MNSTQSLSKDVKDFIRDYVAIGNTDEEKTSLRHECAAAYGLSLPQVRAITAWTTIRANKCLTKNEDVSEEESATSVGAEHFNYNNERKEKWRQKWGKFIESHTAESERANMKVLCLPGKMCLEIPQYLRIGFRPENITGVEGGDEEARETFRRNSDRLGIRAVEGRLEEFLEMDTTRYDVVSLDFPGQLSAPTFKIARKLLLAKKALVLTNFMAKREQSEVQRACIEIQEMLRLSNSDFKQHGAHAFTAGEHKGKETFDEGTFDLRQARTLMGLGYHSNLGLLRMENRLLAKQISMFPIHPTMEEKYKEFAKLYSKTDREQLFRRESIEIAMRFFLEMLGKAFQQHSMPSASANSLVFMLSALGLRGYFGTPFTKEMESYRYVSKSERGGSPFESDFAVLHTPISEYHELRHTLEFILAGARMVMQSAIDGNASGTLCIRNKHGSVLLENQNLSNSDFLWLGDVRNHVHLDIRIRKIFSDLKKYGEIYAGCVTEEIDKGNVIVPRITIE